MDGIIFDVDGTLWDSTKEVAKSWNQVLREHTKLEADLTAKRLEREFGKPMDAIMAQPVPGTGGSEERRNCRSFLSV